MSWYFCINEKVDSKNFSTKAIQKIFWESSKQVLRIFVKSTSKYIHTWSMQYSRIYHNGPLIWQRISFDLFVKALKLAAFNDGPLLTLQNWVKGQNFPTFEVDSLKWCVKFNNRHFPKSGKILTERGPPI